MVSGRRTNDNFVLYIMDRSINMQLAVFTLKSGTASMDSDVDILEALMSLFEAFGVSVVGELTYEDVEECDERQSEA